MIFNKRTEYSIKILLFMMSQNNKYYLNAAEIASKIDLPKEFLSKILQTLTHHGIVISRKGKNGGFRLDKPIEEIKLIELINVFEDPAYFSKCIMGIENICVDCRCSMHENWEKIKYKIQNTNLRDIKKIGL